MNIGYGKTMIIVIILSVFMHSCNNEIYNNNLIIFDYNKSYPEIDLKLSDVADVRYIKMRGESEGFLITSRSGSSNDFFVDESNNRIYTSHKRQLFVYDMNGRPVRMLSKEGRGPQEYLNIFDFYVESATNTVTCYDDSGFLKSYDSLFNFKCTTPFIIPLLKNMVFMNNDTILAYNHVELKQKYKDIPSFFFLVSRSTGKVFREIDIHFERPIMDIYDGPYFLTYPSLIRGKDGVFMTNKCCDTVFWMDNKKLDITPRFIDITNYNTKECMTIPSFETDQYLFFNTHYNLRVSPNVESRYYVYDKIQRQIFRIRAKVYEKFTNVLGLINNQCTLTSTHCTMSEGYAATFLSTVFLEDNMDKLPSELQEIAKTMDENDNPLLMLIKLK